jgi:hypothetical protein
MTKKNLMISPAVNFRVFDFRSAYGHSCASRPGMVGGVGSTVGATAGAVTNTAASVPGVRDLSCGEHRRFRAASAHLTSQLTANSTGVIGHARIGPEHPILQRSPGVR